MTKMVGPYLIMEFVGKGTSGEVYKALNQKTKSIVAAKRIPKTIANLQGMQKYISGEVSLLKKLRRNNIIKLEATIETQNSFYIFLEFCNGGSLSQCLTKFKRTYGFPFTEKIVQHIMRKIVDAMCYLHRNKIVHRDLKLENILVNFNSEVDRQNLSMLKCDIKIVDFGYSVDLNHTYQNLAQTALGTPLYMAPTILRKLRGYEPFKGYDEKIDIWSMGVLCYELLVGERLFKGTTENELLKLVEKGAYTFPINLSNEAISFISSMLQYDCKIRATAEQLSKHDFLNKSVEQFTKIDLNKHLNEITDKGLNMNIKHNFYKTYNSFPSDEFSSKFAIDNVYANQ